MDHRYGPGFLPYRPPVAIAARGLGKLGGMLDIPINGDSIKLGQFIKLASLVATGGEAKELIAEGVVTVNGEPETRRGACLLYTSPSPRDRG